MRAHIFLFFIYFYVVFGLFLAQPMGWGGLNNKRKLVHECLSVNSHEQYSLN
jgi:hypothetical protein